MDTTSTIFVQPSQPRGVVHHRRYRLAQSHTTLVVCPSSRARHQTPVVGHPSLYTVVVTHRHPPSLCTVIVHCAHPHIAAHRRRHTPVVVHPSSCPSSRTRRCVPVVVHRRRARLRILVLAARTAAHHRRTHELSGLYLHLLLHTNYLGLGEVSPRPEIP